MGAGEQLTAVAADLDERGYPFAGAVRQAAHRIVELEAQTAAQPAGAACAGCGAPLAYGGRGRPRRWCSERCRRRARP